ncbi:peroxiredoxin family protein [Bacteroides ovatus]|uniref:peroxiredoxin family protein n=1 Tax=Bacteroides ovatus TaxID=28116 RepID=UPI0022DEBBC0|nr:hypothetical protein [Bacteroides ovatus]
MNRKQYCIAALIFIVALMISLFVIISVKKQSSNNLYSFDVTSVHMDIENRNAQLSMHPTKSTMCIFFNTECDLCIKEILYIEDNLEIFSRKYNLVLISFEDANKLIEYKNTIISKGSSSPLIFVSDTNFKFIDKYDVSVFPTILVFSKDGIEQSRCIGINIDFLKQLKSNIQ